MNWNDVNWTSCELKVYNLQCKIFKASKNNSIREVRKLQRELIKWLRPNSYPCAESVKTMPEN